VQSAGVERGRNGFRKNKSTEKNPESEEDLLEHRTDGTDAFDTLYIGCEKFPQHDFYGDFSVGGGEIKRLFCFLRKKQLYIFASTNTLQNEQQQTASGLVG
jgi:hypothetical protein